MAAATKDPLLGGLLGLAFGCVCVWFVVSSVRSGTVSIGGRRRRRRVYTRGQQPVRYWFHVLVYVALAVAVFAFSAWRLSSR